MKCLFIMHPLFGHFHAMVPLAQALKDHGHEVAFATGERIGPIVTKVGFTHFACGQNCPTSRVFFEDLPEWPDIVAKVSHPGIQQLWGFIQVFAPAMADDVIDLMEVWKPDIIVRDPSEFGSVIVAELFDLPYASLHWAVFMSTYGCLEPLTVLRQRYGLPEDPSQVSFDRYLVLNALPPAWELEGPVPPLLHRYCMPPFDLSLDSRLPEWVHTLPDQPTVYATLGTAFNQAPEHFRAMIAALGSEDFNTIITVGPTMDPAQFHPLPPQVKVEQYIPHSLILPYCDVFVFHGGYNSLLSALWHGVPMVIVPMEGGDQQPTAEQCARLGVGLPVEGCPPPPEVIRDAVKRVLDQPSYRQHTQQLRQAIMNLPPLSEAVYRLETLAKTHEPQLTD